MSAKVSLRSNLHKIAPATLALLLHAIGASAEERPWSAHRPSITWTTDWFAYLDESTLGGGDQHLVRSDLQFLFEGVVGDHFNYSIVPQLRIDSGDHSESGFAFLEDGKRRPVATFREASLGWSSNAFELSIGKQIFNWGVADAWSPIDDLNPWDYLDVPTAERIGVPAISIYHLSEKFEIQGVWQPFFTPSRIPLPGIDSRWFPDPEGFSAPAMAFSQFTFQGRDLPATQLENSQFGLRLSSSVLLDGWDLGAVYYRGHQSAGVFKASPAGSAINAVLEYPRYQEFGLSFATVFGPWQVHGEGSYHDTDEEEMDDDYIEYIIGINRSFPDPPIPFVDEATMVIEYAGQEVTRAKSSDSPYFGSRQFLRPFADALVGSLTLSFSDDTELNLSASHDFADGGSYYGTDFSHKFSDHVKCSIACDFFAGPGNSFFGKWGKNDRLSVSLTVNM